jgi:hypothetical protein
MKNESVIKAFMNNQYAQSKNLRSAGINLYSYNLRIGITDDSGQKYVFNHTAKGGDFRSHTTSMHIGLARKLGCIVAPIHKV